MVKEKAPLVENPMVGRSTELDKEGPLPVGALPPHQE
jgi:hypothetical protein